MASGMIMPKPLEPTPFDVEIFVKAPIVIPPEEVISNMLDHDNKSEEDQRVMPYFQIRNFTCEKVDKIVCGRWCPKDIKNQLLQDSMQQQVHVHVILYGILTENDTLKDFRDILKDSLSKKISEAISEAKLPTNISVFMKTELKPGIVQEDNATKIGDSYHGIIVGEQDGGQSSAAGLIEWMTEQHLIPDGGLPPWLASAAGEPTPGAQEN